MAQQLLHHALRAAAIFFGATITGHFLATNRADRGPVEATGPSGSTGVGGYLGWLLDALVPDGATVGATGHTMLLASIAVLVAGAIGWIMVAAVGDGVGFRAARGGLVPALAFVGPPGAALVVALLRRIDGGALTAPADLGDSVFPSIRALVYGGIIVGLAVAPAAAALPGGATDRAFGIGAVRATLASRPEPWSGWQFGLPTTTFLLALASVEVVGTRSGLVHRFVTALQAAEVGTTLDALVVLALAGAIIAVAVDVVSDRSTGGREAHGYGSPVSGVGSAPDPGLVSGSTSPPDRARGDTELSRWFLPFLWAAVITATFGLWGSLSLAAETDPAAGGVELLRSIAATLGPAMLSGVLPAAVAIGLGWLVASIQHRLDPAGARIVGACVDVLWWPLPISLALAHRYLSAPSDPSVHPATIALTGLALSPVASRLIGRELHLGGLGMSNRLVSSWLYMGATAAGLHLTLGLMGQSGAEPTLGGLIGAAGRAEGLWPTLAPPLAGALLLGLFLGLGAGLSRPVRTDVTSPAHSLDRSNRSGDFVPLADAGHRQDPVSYRDVSPADRAEGRGRGTGHRAAAGPERRGDNHFLVITQPIDRSDLGLPGVDVGAGGPTTTPPPTDRPPSVPSAVTVVSNGSASPPAENGGVPDGVPPVSLASLFGARTDEPHVDQRPER